MASQPDPVDIHVGARIRLRRKLVGMSMEKLAPLLGVTWQQLQKYEKGANRIAPSRLHRVAEALKVPISFFFDDMPGFKSTPPAPVSLDNEVLEFVRAYHRIGDPAVRQKICNLVKSIAASEKDHDRKP